MTFELMIFHGDTVQFPAVEAGAKLTLERKGSPGKLDFTVVKTAELDFTEGDAVKLVVGGTTMFYGFVFTKKRTKGDNITVTAYDQIRYLKNKDTVTEEGIKASDLLTRLAADFHLNVGTVEDTSYRLETIVEENQTLLDMLQNALDETLRQTGRLYVLYDDCGKLTLRHISSMKLDLLLDGGSAADYTYESTIDSETYNKIKLSYANKDTGRREIYVVQDNEKMNQWGVLQYFEDLQSQTGASAKAEALLSLYGHKSRSLTVKGAFGDVRVRGGSAVVVSLKLGDVIVQSYMVVNKVTHTFGGGGHTMELDLMGGDFFG